MSKTILIGTNNKFSARANQWLFCLMGLLFAGNGFFHIYTKSVEPVGPIIGTALLLLGLYYSIYGLTAFSRKSNLALRASVDEEKIVLKNSFFKPAIQLGVERYSIHRIR